MTIRYLAAPPSSEDALRGALNERLPSLALRGQAATRAALTAPSAVRYFHLGLEALNSPQPLQQAQHNGWRYSLEADRGATMAKIGDEAEDHPPAFQGIAGGVLAQRFHEALALAEAELGPTAEVFEPRVLEVPALSYVALWLSGAQDLFIPLLDGKPPGTGPLAISTDIWPELQYRASKRRPHAFVRGASSTPTN